MIPCRYPPPSWPDDLAQWEESWENDDPYAASIVREPWYASIFVMLCAGVCAISAVVIAIAALG